MARVKDHSEEWAADQGLILTESQMIRNLEAENAKLKEDQVKIYKAAYEEGLRAYAWWKDGIQYVGSCGTTLKEALKENDHGTT